jgi:2-polyprenyl-3-methyl-5-hydroxy-6-metoxy-1,4-benzoquinol methylase
MMPSSKRDFFNGIASRWDEVPGPPDEANKLERFVAQAVPAGARRILDIGCGTGILLAPLRRRGTSTRTSIVEMDSAEQMLVLNRQKSNGYCNVAHVCADVDGIPFAAGFFDTILCFNTLPHLCPIPLSLARMLECLSPSGLLSIGHLMSSENLNAMHADIGGAVHRDQLPEAECLAALLCALNAAIIRVEEAPDWYFVQARKRR